MELELQKERYDCYRRGVPVVATQEETAETIVPDYSPDVTRIVDASACLLLRGQNVADGKLTVSGSVKLALLYMAEGAQGLRSLEYTVPFEHSEKLPENCEKAAVEGRICGVETRLLNPRKLFTRLDIEWRVTPYCRTVFAACGEITEQSGYAIETLCEKHEVSLIRSVSQKDFSFTEELAIPGGCEAIAELLCPRVKLRVTEAKSIGGKVILKGIACVSLLYAAEDGKLCSYAEELPFSQILDGVSPEEKGDMSASAVLNMSGCEIHTENEGGEGRAVSVKLFLSAFVVLRGLVTVQCVTDLYSTAYELDAQMESIELWQEPETESVTQNVREQIDIGTDARCVVSADVCFGGVSVRQENGKAVVRTSATVSVLYQDENGVPLSVERRIEVSAEAGVNGSAQASVESVCAGDITASVSTGGIEVRFPVEFKLTTMDSPSCMCLTGLSAAEPAQTDNEDVPSLVLRALNSGETLWSVAKQYRTTVEEILSANELTDSAELAAGRMLLIPRKR